MSKPLSETLRLFQRGAFNVECGEKLADVIRGVEDTGRAGKLTITIDVKKAGGALSVLAKVTDKTPEEVADADLFWATVEGNLTPQNPNQQNLDLRTVETPKAPIRNVDPETGEIRQAG